MSTLGKYSVPFFLLSVEDVSGGEVKVDIKYDILGVPVTVFKDTLDLCELVKDARVECPIKAGTYSFTLIRLLPNETKTVSDIRSTLGDKRVN